MWLAAQARKVHASICADILWCIRYGGPEKKMRGANPLSCKICEQHIRDVCPAYAKISGSLVKFNSSSAPTDWFRIRTSKGNNTDSPQTIVSCTGKGVPTFDEYSTRDKPDQFKAFPLSDHHGEDMTVAEFIKRY